MRYIQFDFDVEADTAFSVASEMIRELDLSEQDVGTMAAIIDEEMISLVPGWRPSIEFEGVVEEHADD